MCAATRYSCGIALCKRGHDGIVRLLMANKRYTYAFFKFVCGKYNEHNDQEIISLIDQMTLDEKLDILSLNFQQLWYRIWLAQSQSALFRAAHSKYREHIIGFSGERVRSLVRRSRRFAERIWEIPKGRKKSAQESDMECAIREFYEETGIPRSAYRITDFVYHIVFDEDGRRYDFTYFVAITTRDITQRINSEALDQVGEICDMHWVSAAEIQYYAPRDVAGHRRILHYAKRRLANPLLRSATSAQWRS